MKGIKSLDWHIKRAKKKNLTATRLYPKPIKWRSMCAQWPWDWLDLHLRVDRNGLQMNEIRSMCSGDTVTFDRRNENKSFKFHLKPWCLKKKHTLRTEFVFLLVELIYVKELGAFFHCSFLFSSAPLIPCLFNTVSTVLCFLFLCLPLPFPLLVGRWLSRLLRMPL